MSKWKFLLAAGSLVPAAVLLYQVAPGEGTYYPRCPFHTLTGLHCPGCGATRCLHALLHGDLRQAAAYNILFLLFLAPISIWVVHCGILTFAGKPLTTWRLPTWAVWLIIIIVVGFGIIRNMPFAPLSALAPHQL